MTNSIASTVRSTTPGMGWSVLVLGTPYVQVRNREEARDAVKNIAARCAGLTKPQIAALYKTGN